MRILIVTAWYAPFFHPRAHRWTALAEHWASEGRSVTVLTARVGGQARVTRLNGVTIHRTGFDSLKEVFYYLIGDKSGRGRAGAGPQQPSRFMRLAYWLYQVCWKKIYFPDDACIWYFPAKRKMYQLLDRQPFDVIITVAWPFTSHLLGLAARRRIPSLRWLADVGDPFSIGPDVPNNSFLYKSWNRKLEATMLAKASAVTVTNAALKAAYEAEFGQVKFTHCRVIPPLVHPWPEQEAARERTMSSIKVGYFGAFYRPVRTPETVLDVLGALLRQAPQLEIHFYGEIFPEFLPLFAMLPQVTLHGLVDRNQVRAAMGDMDVLLHVGNKSSLQLPSKVAEYIASGKPVLHLSQADPDPALSFFTDWEGFFVLKIENEKVSASDLATCATWLTHLPGLRAAAEVSVHASAFSLASVAMQYRQCWEGWPESGPGTSE